MLFTRVRENMNFSEEGLLKTFPTHFNKEQAATYAHQPIKIASRVYADRMGNGNEAGGEGNLFLGRGYLGLTGKDNYRAFAQRLGKPDIVSNPDQVATKYPLLSAAFFFDTHGLWDICDCGAINATIERITMIINGGLIGLQDRAKLFERFYQLLHTA